MSTYCGTDIIETELLPPGLIPIAARKEVVLSRYIYIELILNAYPS